MNTKISKVHKGIAVSVTAFLGLGLLSARPAEAQRAPSAIAVQAAPVGMTQRLAIMPGTTTLSPGQFGLLPNNFNPFGFPGSRFAPNIVSPQMLNPGVFQPNLVNFGGTTIGTAGRGTWLQTGPVGGTILPNNFNPAGFPGSRFAPNVVSFGNGTTIRNGMAFPTWLPQMGHSPALMRLRALSGRRR
jgi:hypothetical protein